MDSRIKKIKEHSVSWVEKLVLANGKAFVNTIDWEEQDKTDKEILEEQDICKLTSGIGRPNIFRESNKTLATNAHGHTTPSQANSLQNNDEHLSNLTDYFSNRNQL